MTAFDISFLIIAIAFAILVVFLVLFIVSLRKTLKRVDQSIVILQKKVNELGHEPQELIHNASAITADIYGKLRYLDPLFRTVHNLGESLETKTSRFKEKTFWVPNRKLGEPTFEEEEGHKQSTASDVLEWALLGINIWKKFKKGERS